MINKYRIFTLSQHFYPMANSSHFKTFAFRVLFLIGIVLLPSVVRADWLTDFVRLDIAQAYLKKYPYLIQVTGTESKHSVLFKVEKVYMDGNSMMVSGPVILKWTYYSSYSYTVPEENEMMTTEMEGMYLYGYYPPMRVAFPLVSLFMVTGDNVAGSEKFPDPEVIPNVEKGYAAWMEQLPEVLREYCMWWYEKASVGPPVFHSLIDSVLSAPEGGCKPPPDEYVDLNFCPGEGCTYGEWKTSEAIIVVDKPKGTRKVAAISAGETFAAITGNVYVRPKEMIATETFEAYDSEGSIILEPGRKYYILSNLGEGHAHIWVNGRIMISEEPYNDAQQWWVEVKTRQGKKGWILFPDTGCISGADFLE